MSRLSISWEFAGYIGMLVTSFVALINLKFVIIIIFDNVDLLELLLTDASVATPFIQIVINGFLFLLITYRMYKCKLFRS